MSTNNTLIDIAGYTVHGLLGKGGMAEVYLATQDSLRRKVAVKVLLSTDDDSFIQRFINEGHVVASLNHPAIITIYDINQLTDGRYYLAMEFIAGGDLTQYKGQVFEPARALNIIKQIAEGLSVLHDKGLIHRDIKPANILFRSEDSVVITDFGIAKDMSIDSELTHAGIAVGSPAYSSPEQAQCEALDQRTDIYSLGVVLAEMLTGVNSYRGSSYTQTVLNHVQMEPPTLPTRLSTYQPLLDRMLAKNPAERFANCKELLLKLNTLLNNSVASTSAPVATTRPEPARTPASPASKNAKWFAVAGAILVMVLLAVSAPKIMTKLKVSGYLRQAEQHLNAGKLTQPANDNADYFYRQALALDPANADAAEGLQKVMAARIAKLITMAEQRLAKNQLSMPEGDNAVVYFRQALELAPDNQQALTGLHRVVEHYISQAKDAHIRGEYKTSLNYINQGLALEPTNDTLLQLLDDNHQATSTAKPDASAGSSKKPARNKKSSNPLQRFWNKLW